jgi:hypothetical protein
MYDADDQLWKAWWSTVIVADCSQIGMPSEEISIEYAESSDGVHWTVQAESALASKGATTAWDYTTVETPTVIKDPTATADHRYAMIYAGGNDARLKVLGNTGWQLGLAFSADGKTFTRVASPYSAAATPFQDVTGLVLLARDAFPQIANQGDGILADPELVKIGDTWRLYFSSAAMNSAETMALAYGISTATSTDLIHWMPGTANPLLVGAGQPAVLATNGLLEMWFNRDSDEDKAMVPSTVFATLGVWHSTSSDGLAWSTETARDFAWDGSIDAETYGFLPGVAVAHDPSGGTRMYYSAWGAHPAPANSCVLTHQGSVPGSDNFSLATR